jgi:hypothetical protein
MHGVKQPSRLILGLVIFTLITIAAVAVFSPMYVKQLYSSGPKEAGK